MSIRRWLDKEDVLHIYNKILLLLLLSRLSHVWLCATPWTAAYQAPPSVGFSRQEYWSGLPFPFPGDLPNPGIKPGSPTLQADSLPSESPGTKRKTNIRYYLYVESKIRYKWIYLQNRNRPLNKTSLWLPKGKEQGEEKIWSLGLTDTHCSVQSLSHVWLCDPMNCSTSGLPVHHKLLEFTQTHVHQVSDAIQPSHPLSSPSPPASNPSRHQSLFQWVNSSHEVAKVLEFQL